MVNHINLNHENKTCKTTTHTIDVASIHARGLRGQNTTHSVVHVALKELGQLRRDESLVAAHRGQHLRFGKFVFDAFTLFVS